MIKKLGSWIGSIKRYVNNIQSQVTDVSEINIDKDDKVKKSNDLTNKKDENV